MIPVMRFTGTSIWRASSAADVPMPFSSSAKCSPGWIAVPGTMLLLRSSGAELVGQIHEVACRDVNRHGRLGLPAARAALGRARHVGGAQALGGGRRQVVAVGGHHHALTRLKIERL